MCALCIVKLHSDHFSQSLHDKCWACGAFPKHTFNHYKRKAAFYNKHVKWISVAAITKFYQYQHKEQEEPASTPIHTDAVMEVAVDTL